MATWLKDFFEKSDLNQYPIAHRFPGGIGFQVGREVVSSFVGHPVHYEENREMKPITLDWIPATGEFEGSWFGWDVVKKCPTYCGYELYTPKAIKWNGLYYPLSFLRLENRMIADTPIGTYEIIFNEWGMNELFTIPEPVEGTLEFDAPEQSGWGEYLYINPRRIIDGDQAGNVFTITEGMEFPVLIDPDYSANTGDAQIEGSSATYATARSTSTASDSTATRSLIDNTFFSGSYYVRRLATKFDTSGIPDTDVVSQVTQTHKVESKSVATDSDVQIVKYDWSASDPIGSGNRETVFDGILAGTLDDAFWKNTSAISAGTAYTSGNLSTSWVNKTGYTYYGLMLSRDRNNTAPSGVEQIGLYTQNDATAGNRPVLTVTHAAAQRNSILLKGV